MVLILYRIGLHDVCVYVCEGEVAKLHFVQFTAIWLAEKMCNASRFFIEIEPIEAQIVEYSKSPTISSRYPENIKYKKYLYNKIKL